MHIPYEWPRGKMDKRFYHPLKGGRTENIPGRMDTSTEENYPRDSLQEMWVSINSKFMLILLLTSTGNKVTKLYLKPYFRVVKALFEAIHSPAICVSIPRASVNSIRPGGRNEFTTMKCFRFFSTRKL